jgi:glycosyltransferase involved in cell wall biosynthesis
MKVSIIIPSYGQEKYLPDAIESALSQTVPCEVIVIDDGSLDNSLKIARGYEKIKVVAQVNKGLASARNTGIMNAIGDFILPLDADDILMDNCVEKLLELQKETDADIVGPSIRAFGESNGDVVLMKDPKLEDFKVGNRLPYACLMRKSKLLEIGGYSPKMVWGYEDLHIWYNLLSRGAKLVTTPEILMLYRTKKESMITTAQQHHDELMAQIKKDFPYEA